MKRWLKFTLPLIPLLLFAGCGTTKTLLLEYGPDGKVIKKTYLESDAVGKLMDEMKTKDIAWYKNGWFFTIECTITSQDTYMPTIKFTGGKANSGHISLRPDTKETIMPACLKEMQPGITVTTSSSGISISDKKNEKEN